MLSKDALSQAQAEFDKYYNEVDPICLTLTLCFMRLSVAMKEASGQLPCRFSILNCDHLAYPHI
jgi:hypothetical protein